MGGQAAVDHEGRDERHHQCDHASRLASARERRLSQAPPPVTDEEELEHQQVQVAGRAAVCLEVPRERRTGGGVGEVRVPLVAREGGGEGWRAPWDSGGGRRGKGGLAVGAAHWVRRVRGRWS